MTYKNQMSPFCIIGTAERAGYGSCIDISHFFEIIPCYLDQVVNSSESLMYVLIILVDADKQMAINVFLGVYKPGEGIPDIWDLSTDYYLHHTMARVLPSSHATPNHTKWWDSQLIETLPLPLYKGMLANIH